MSQDVEAAQQRMLKLQRRMQAGVAQEMNVPGRQSATEPKHLRVGVNTALIEGSAVAKILIEKGVFTELEYFTAIGDLLQREVDDYERRLSQHYGTKITLGGTLEDLG